LTRGEKTKKMKKMSESHMIQPRNKQIETDKTSFI